jgi:hypothetical protein
MNKLAVQAFVFFVGRLETEVKSGWFVTDQIRSKN